MRPTLAMCALVLTLPALAPAAVITTEQTLHFQTVAPFGTFTQDTAAAGGWSVAFPFSNAAQITGISVLFSTTDGNFNDPATFPPGNGGGVPGVEIGVLREDGPGRLALSSVNAAGPGFALDLTDPAHALLRNWLADGAITASIGAFTNFPNAAAPFSTGLTISAPSTLRLRVTGNVPDTNPVPEPGSLALAGVALAALAGRAARACRGRLHPQAALKQDQPPAVCG